MQWIASLFADERKRNFWNVKYHICHFPSCCLYLEPVHTGYPWQQFYNASQNTSEEVPFYLGQRAGTENQMWEQMWQVTGCTESIPFSAWQMEINVRNNKELTHRDKRISCHIDHFWGSTSAVFLSHRKAVISSHAWVWDTSMGIYYTWVCSQDTPGQIQSCRIQQAQAWWHGRVWPTGSSAGKNLSRCQDSKGPISSESWALFMHANKLIWACTCRMHLFLWIQQESQDII